MLIMFVDTPPPSALKNSMRFPEGPKIKLDGKGLKVSSPLPYGERDMQRDKPARLRRLNPTFQDFYRKI